MGQDVILVEREGPVVLITMNRPEKRNALNAALSQGIVDAIASAQDARAIVITGAGPAFCAGLDLRDLGVERLVDLPRASAAVADSGVPVIGAVNGPAVTGGFEVALACDFLIGSERAAFADTHGRVNVFPGPVLIDLPRRVGMAWAREMSLTGNFVDAATAERIGILNRVVPHEELVPRAMQLARDIAEIDPELIRLVRQAWDETETMPAREARSERNRYAAMLGHGGQKGADIAARRETVISRAKTQRQG